MLELEEAVARIVAAVPQPVPESVPLREAHRRFLAEPVRAGLDLPLFDNSSVDGYAVRAVDVSGARPAAPARLRLAGRVAAGQTFEAELAAGTSVRLFTGSPLPRGSDAVVMQEHTRLEPGHAGEILVLEPVKAWENVRFRGEDVKRDAMLMSAGEPLTVGAIALLAGIGLTHASVGRKPVVGLLATGSELTEPGRPLEPGRIYESNRIALAVLVQRSGGIPNVLPIVPDDPASTRAALERAFAECDAVVSCGGVSVGEMDFVKGAFEQLGGTLQFWKVAIKPGRPFVFGRVGVKLLFGLPGNPVSALVTYLLLVRPALLRWQGAQEFSLPAHTAVLGGALTNPGTRRHFMRVTVDASGAARSAGVQASHILSSAAAANGLVDVPPNTTFPAGTAVPVLRWE